MDQPLLEVQGLTKHFPVLRGILRRQVDIVRAVNGVDFTLQRGQVLGLVGESGCGKTTIGRCLMRLVEPTSGSMRLKGQEMNGLSTRNMRRLRRHIQMVFQDPYASLNPRKTISDAIGEGLLYHSIVRTPQERDARVAHVLQQVGLSPDILRRYPHQFSGGQQQRICIGRAIALEPDLIVCDEAASALDVSVQAQILNLLRDLKDSLGLSYLFISHDLAVVEYLCDHVIVLYKGLIVEEAPTATLFRNPLHPYTQALLAAPPADHPRDRRKKRRTAVNLDLAALAASPLIDVPGSPGHRYRKGDRSRGYGTA